jgi:hypothetical protein
VVAAVVTPYKTASSMITSEVNCSVIDDEAATTVEPPRPSEEEIEQLNITLISLRECKEGQFKDHLKRISSEHLKTYGSLDALTRHDKFIKLNLLNYFMKPGVNFDAKKNTYGKGRDRDRKRVTRKATDLYDRIVKAIAKDQGISIQKSSSLATSSYVASKREQQTADRFQFSVNNQSQSPVKSEFLEKEPIDETIDSDDNEGSDTECIDIDSVKDSSDSKDDDDGVEGDDKSDSESVNSGDGDDKGVDGDADFDDKGHDDGVDGAGIKVGVDKDDSSDKGDGIDSNSSGEEVDGDSVDRDGIDAKGDSVDRDCGDDADEEGVGVDSDEDDEEGVGVDSDEDDEEGDEDENSDEDFEEEDSDKKIKKAVTVSDESNQEGPATRSAKKRRSSSGVVEMQHKFTDTMASDTVEKRPLFTHFKKSTESDDEGMSPSDSQSDRHKSKMIPSCFGYIVFIKGLLSNWVKIGVGTGSKRKSCSRYATAYPGTVTMIW